MKTADAVLMGIIGLAVLAIIVSKNSQTASVVQAIGSVFSSALNIAVGNKAS
jgi:PRD1 phage membrane DNA delivery